MKSFLLELKSICKNAKFLILVLALLAYQIILIAQFQEAGKIEESSQLRINASYKRRSENWLRYWQKEESAVAGGNPKYSAKTIAFHLDWYEYEVRLANDLIKAQEEKDWPLYNRCMVEKCLLIWGIHSATVDTRTPSKRIPGPKAYFGQEWDKLTSLIEQRDFSQLPLWVFEDREMYSFEATASLTDYYYSLLKGGLPPADFQGQDPWTVTFRFLRVGLPGVLGAIVLLFTADLLHKDKVNGAIKTRLQRPGRRSRYLARKLSLGALAGIILVLIPLVLTFFFVGLSNGFQGSEYPVLISNNALKFSLPSDSTIDSAGYSYRMRWTRRVDIGLSKYVPSLSGTRAINHMRYIPLWQFLCFAMGGLLGFIVLCSTLGLIISVTVKNSVIAQVCAIGAFGLGGLLQRFCPGYQATVWDLFGKANTISLLEGGQQVTYLHSMAAVVAVSGVFFGLAALCFWRQDITS